MGRGAYEGSDPRAGRRPIFHAVPAPSKRGWPTGSHGGAEQAVAATPAGIRRPEPLGARFYPPRLLVGGPGGPGGTSTSPGARGPSWLVRYRLDPRHGAGWGEPLRLGRLPLYLPTSLRVPARGCALDNPGIRYTSPRPEGARWRSYGIRLLTSKPRSLRLLAPSTSRPTPQRTMSSSTGTSRQRAGLRRGHPTYPCPISTQLQA